MLLIINTILFNSNSENGFSGFKKIWQWNSPKKN
jgi:hypothetical protein